MKITNIFTALMSPPNANDTIKSSNLLDVAPYLNANKTVIKLALLMT
jgi:hypothetical protein